MLPVRKTVLQMMTIEILDGMNVIMAQKQLLEVFLA